jgi:hypothetical protein
MSTAQQQILNQIYALPESEQQQIIRQLLAKAFRSPKFSLAGSITHVGDLEAGTQELRRMVKESLQRTAEQLQEINAEEA